MKYRHIISWRRQTVRNSNLERKEYLLLCTKRIFRATSPILCADLPRLGARALIIIMLLSRLFSVQNSGMYNVIIKPFPTYKNILKYGNWKQFHLSLIIMCESLSMVDCYYLPGWEKWVIFQGYTRRVLILTLLLLKI